MENYLMTSVIVFTTFIVLIKLVFGAQKSISDFYYIIKDKYKWRSINIGRILFILTIWGFTVPLAVASESGLFFIAGTLICIIGAAPDFKASKGESIAHNGGVFSGIPVAFIALIIDYNMWGLFAVDALVSILLYKLKNRLELKHIWYIEICAYYLLVLGVYLKNNDIFESVFDFLLF